jgi:hypothetical protein
MTTPPDNKSDLRQITAFHEAGHAAISIALGLDPFLFIALDAAEPERGGLRVIVSQRNPEERAVMYLAGCIAESIFIGQPLLQVLQKGDMLMAANALMQSPRRPRPTLDQALARARAVVAEQWDNGNIPAIAEALINSPNSRLS